MVYRWLMADDAIEELLREIEETVASALLSPSELDRFQTLPDRLREKACRRLALIAAWNGPRRSELASAEALAAHEGISRRAFFNLVSNSESPSLDGLGLNLVKRRRDAKAAARRMSAGAEIERLLSLDPSASVSVVVKAVRAAGIELSASVLSRMVDDARRSAPPRGPFGARLSYDSAGMDLVDAAGIRQRLFALVDDGSGLLLGWSIHAQNDFTAGYRAAARMALSVEERGMPDDALASLATAASATITLALPLGAPDGVLEDVRGEQGWSRVGDSRLVGRMVVAAVGREIAGTTIGSGVMREGVSHRHGRLGHLAVITPALRGRIDEDIRAHDGRRLEIALRAPYARAPTMLEEAALPIATMRR